MTRVGLLGVMLVVATSAAAAQTAPAAQAPASQPQAPAAQPVEAAKPGYSYDPEGRRDPFQSLLGRGNDPQGAREIDRRELGPWLRRAGHGREGNRPIFFRQ